MTNLKTIKTDLEYFIMEKNTLTLEIMASYLIKLIEEIEELKGEN